MHRVAVPRESAPGMPVQSKYLFTLIALIFFFNGFLYYTTQSHHVLPHTLTESEKRAQAGMSIHLLFSHPMPSSFLLPPSHRLSSLAPPWLAHPLHTITDLPLLFHDAANKKAQSGVNGRIEATAAQDAVASGLTSIIHRRSTDQLLTQTKSEEKSSVTKEAHNNAHNADFRPIYNPGCHLEAHADCT